MEISVVYETLDSMSKFAITRFPLSENALNYGKYTSRQMSVLCRL